MIRVGVIGAGVYDPVAIHRQRNYPGLGYKDTHPNAGQSSLEVPSVPVHPAVTTQEIEFNADILRRR